MTIHQNESVPAMGELGKALHGAFKFLAWANGLGVLTLLFTALGVLPSEVSAQWLRFPLAIFLGGLALCTLGLLWSYPVLTSLITQAVSGRVRRGHWIPLFCTMLSYMLSLLAFVLACWFTHSVAAYSGGGGGYGAPLGHEEAWPFDQSLDDRTPEARADI